MTNPPPVPPQPYPAATNAAMDEPAIDAIEEAGADGTETISPDAVRKLANAHFARGDYGTALPLYSLAIDGCRGLTAAPTSSRGSGGDDTGDNSATMKAEGEGEEAGEEAGEKEERGLGRCRPGRSGGRTRRLCRRGGGPSGAGWDREALARA